MEEDLQFLYCQEFWYVSAFLNTEKVIGEDKAEEIELLILERLNNLTEKDLDELLPHLRKLPRAEDRQRKLIDMGKNIAIECDWEPYFQSFPYTDENKDTFFTTLGYFKFEVEYYKNDPFKKELITPDLIQQIPIIVLNLLKDFSIQKENEFLLIDTESPIFVFVTSNKIKPVEIHWTHENINKYKKILGYWIEIYSGQWLDYSEDLFDKRIENNLSNRLSELHYICRNSGFIYMAAENYSNFFNYIETFVLDPTPKVRSMVFALMTINQSLDILFLKRHSDVFMSLESIEKKIRNLRYLRGLIETKLTSIYNELDWNRRQHYTKVLNHLINEFNLDEIFNRVNGKFKVIYDMMQELYQKKNEANQKRTERGLKLLSLLFGAGILGDLAQVTIIALRIGEGDPLFILFNSIISIIVAGILISTVAYFIYIRIKKKAAEEGKTVDAVIEDGKGNIILIKRKYPPYKGKYALPGGFIKYDENPEQALVREVREETNLSVKIIDKIGTYDQEGRDPRGKIISKAFKCKLVSDISNIQSGDDSAAVELIPIAKLKDINLAFDHKKILADAGVLK